MYIFLRSIFVCPFLCFFSSLFSPFFIALALDEATGVQYNNVKVFFSSNFVRSLARQTLVKLNTSKNLYETIEGGFLNVFMHQPEKTFFLCVNSSFDKFHKITFFG